MKLSSLTVEIQSSKAVGDTEFNSVSTDTRTVVTGDLFVALKGENFDGHEFVHKAIEKGACAVVVERELQNLEVPQLMVPDTTLALGIIAACHRRNFKGKVIGITGSCGKTTVKGMLSEICAQAGESIATDGNLNNHIGVPLTLMRIKGGESYAVVEAGTSAPGEIAYLGNLIKPDVALVNNVQPAHLEGLKSVDAIAEEKGSLYTNLNDDGVAVINLDDTYAEKFIQQNAGKGVMGFSLMGESNITKTSVVNRVTGRQSTTANGLVVECGSDSVEVVLQVLGRANQMNALAASACSIAAGISLEDIKAGLESFKGAPGRMQVKNSDKAKILVDDTYNANPGSVIAALDFLGGHENGVLIFGDMAELGSEAVVAHKQIGQHAKEKNIGKLLCVGEKSRFTVEAFGIDGEWYETQSDLIRSLSSMDLRESVVLVKGSRSAKMENVVQALETFGGSQKC